MSEDQDFRITGLLKADAPPPRDPVFRVSVLERREQKRFQRRLYTMLAGALVILLVATLAVNIRAGALGTMGVLAVGAALASAYVAFRGFLPQILRRFSI
jgi:hypothetical protein